MNQGSFNLIRYVIILAVFTSCALGARGQVNPRTVGTVSNVKPTACPAGFANQAACSTAVVSCPDVADIGVTFGLTPGVSGTIVSINGTGGTEPGGGPFSGYVEAGFSIAQFAFGSPWEDGGDILASACRPATMLDFFHSSHPGKPYCAQGASAGAAALGYALSWYGLETQLANVEMIVGPVLTNIQEGCEVPQIAPVTITPTNGLPFSDAPQFFAEAEMVSKWTGQQCLPSGGSSSSANGSWAAQSIFQTGALLNYGTRLAGWGCDNGLNPSSAQSYLFFSEVTSPWTWTRLSDCTGAEGVSTAVTPQGVKGSIAITSDMLAQCVKPSKE